MSILQKILNFLGFSSSNNNTNGKSQLGSLQETIQKAKEQRAQTFPQISNWVIDKYHSSVNFRVMHMGISEVVGSFKNFEIQFYGTSPNFNDMKVYAIIDVNSIQTDMIARDMHLKSPDFFEANKYPKIEFQSLSVQWKPLRFFTIDGNLTIKGVTKPVKFEGKLDNFLPKDMMGFPRVGFTITAEINRFDWNLSWQMELESKDKVVDDIVKIEIKAEIAQKEGFEAFENYLKQMQG